MKKFKITFSWYDRNLNEKVSSTVILDAEDELDAEDQLNTTTLEIFDYDVDNVIEV